MSGLPLFSFDLGVDDNLFSIGYVEPLISPRSLLRGMGPSRTQGISPSRPEPEPVSASLTSALSYTGATRIAPGRPPSTSARSSTSGATRTASGRLSPTSALASTGGMNTRGGL